MLQKIIILGTGGTIAGWADDPNASTYRSAQVAIADLAQGLSALMPGMTVETEQVAQIDSKDMSEGVWRALLERVAHHLSRAEVAGLVIAHGTDTLEETAFLLSALVSEDKPVVLTGAMRAANSADPDGPANLVDAVRLAASGQIRGVCVVFAGQVHAASQVQKISAFELDAFSSEPHSALGRMTDQGYLGAAIAPGPKGVWPKLSQVLEATAWPRVEWVNSHAGATPWLIRSLMQATSSAPPLRGLVVAGTGAGTIHAAWAEALGECTATGVEVWISTRCAFARLPLDQQLLGLAVPWTPAQARVGLMLHLII
jgi:L-asparaginase